MQVKNKWLIFILVAIAQFMVVLDTSITNVAIPAIKQSLHFDNASLQWVITAYALTFGGFLLLGGRVADLFGRRRVLLTGMIGFTFISLLIGFSNSEAMLIGLRALQGLAAALMSPAALSIVLTTFKEGPERNKALAYWSTVATGGAAVGLLLGGFLTQFFGWQWNFFINVPVGIIIAFAISRLVPAHENEEKNHTDLDIPGAIYVTGGLITLVYVFSQAPVLGWTSVNTIILFALAAVLLVAFLINEKIAKHPLMPLSIFKIRNVTGANIMMAPIFAGMFGMFYLTSIYVQTILNFSPLIAGLCFLPFPIILGTLAPRIAPLVSKYGYKPFLITGPVITAFSILLLTRLPVDGNYLLNVLPTIILMPIGQAMTIMPIMAAGTSGVEANKSGLVSGLLNTSQQMGGALGLSILSSVATSITLTDTHVSHAQSLVSGYDRAFLVSVIFILFAIIIASTVIQQKKKKKLSNTKEQAPHLAISE